MRTGRHRLPGQELDDMADALEGGRSGQRVPRGMGRSIRARLLWILAVPTGALVVLAGAGVAAQAGTYRDADSTVSAVRLVLVTQGFVHELQRERGLTNGLLGSRQRDYREQVDQQRQRADDARGDLDRVLEAAPQEVSTPVRGALDRLASLGDVRAEVDAGVADRTRTLNFYTTAITQLGTASWAGQADLSDAQLLRGLDALRTLSEAKEATALERGFLNGVFATGAFPDRRELASFTEIRAQRLAGLSAFSGRATDTQQTALDGVLRSESAKKARGYEQRAIQGTVERLDFTAQQWWDAMTTVVDDLRTVQQQVGADAEAWAAALRSTALALLMLYIALAIAALAVAAVLGVIVARSITRPLRLLAIDAQDAATMRLPDMVAQIQAARGEPVELPAQPKPVMALQQRHDEIAEVSKALHQVQRTAVELASEQAVLRRNAAESLASLARRNQNLLRRQLRFISDLERDETDPTALANLFELDHLATRMRRNAESLLVLVGERGPRQWSQPVPIGDVVRAALSEVEEYRRVELRRLDETMIIGAAGAELAHLLAELVENALSFSPPDREVEVYGQLTDTGYVIAVLDHGIGMSLEDLARSNARVRGEEMFLVAPTRFLGHYVVGRLAQHLDVDVRLHESPLTGITVRVALPASLIALTVAVEEPVSPAVATPVRPERPELSGRPEPPPVLTPRPLRLGRDSRSAAPVAVLEPPTPLLPPGPPRTRNGLVKRVRTNAAVEEPEPIRRPVIEQPAGSPGRSPADVRVALTSFRAGFERRAGERTQPVSTSNPEGDGTDRE